MSDEYRELRAEIESLRGEIISLNESIEEMRRDVAGFSERNGDYKSTIENEDKKLLSEILVGTRSVSRANGVMVIIAAVMVIACVGLNVWTQWKVKKDMERVNTNYELTTAILSGDAHYWFDGTNYQVARESPAGVYLQKVYAEYQKAKAEAAQAAPQE